jgi:hypothetical protein
VGWSSDSERRLRAAIEVEERDAEWVHNLKAECGRLLPLVNDALAFRAYVSGVVSASRAMLKLKPLEEDAFNEL